MADWFRPCIDRAAQWFQGDKKKMTAAVLLAMIGFILMSAELPGKKEESPQTDMDPATYTNMLEQRLAGLIGQIQGAGYTTVMVILETGEQSVFALDIQQDSDRTDQTHVLLDDGEALVETIHTPRIGGVAVVCEGGDNALVVAKIYEILSSLLGLSTGRISVAKMN